MDDMSVIQPADKDKKEAETLEWNKKCQQLEEYSYFEMKRF